MSPPLLPLMLLAPWLVTAVGCRLVEQPEGTSRSILSVPRLAADGVVLEVYKARIPQGDHALDGSFWELIDEQITSLQRRRTLHENGLRAGQVGGHMPPALEKLLKVRGQLAGTDDVTALDLTQPAAVHKHVLQVRAGRRSEVTLSDIQEAMPVLLRENGQVFGRTYPQAQGLIAMRAHPQADGRVRLELVPEIHYGQPRNRFVGTEGLWRLEPGRPRRALDRLALEVTLSPGEMVVMTAGAERSGSVGHCFFSEQAGGKREQKLLVIRLVQSGRDDVFGEAPAADDKPAAMQYK